MANLNSRSNNLEYSSRLSPAISHTTYTNSQTRDYSLNKPLNQFVINEHFQMENISCLKQILNQNDFMVKLDLKDAYLTVGVHEQSQHYLRFIWQGQPYQFQALPFGLCTAPRVFTKLLKPVITFLRTRNIRLLIYLDDILIVGSDIKTLQEQTGQVLGLLQSLGFIINFEKSVLTPLPVIEFLGLLQ